MKKYYVNKDAQANGDHEVHHQYCIWLPAEENRKELGGFSNCFDAVVEARKYYHQVNGCKTCLRECHSG